MMQIFVKILEKSVARRDDVSFKAYYQWVPFVLMLQVLIPSFQYFASFSPPAVPAISAPPSAQACLFYAPHLLHKAWESGKVSWSAVES